MEREKRTGGFIQSLTLALSCSAALGFFLQWQRLERLEDRVASQEQGEVDRLVQVWKAIEVVAVAVGVDPHGRPAHAERLVKTGKE